VVPFLGHSPSGSLARRHSKRGRNEKCVSKEREEELEITQNKLTCPSTMNFAIPANASRDDIAAIVACDIDAMFDAVVVDTGIDADVTFFHEDEEREAGDGEKNNTNNMNDSNNNTDSSEEGEEEGVLTLTTMCGECGEDPCFFSQHEQLLVAFDDAEHGSLAAEDVPANNILRKKLYRQLTLLINGGPLGAGVRKELPSCCVSAVRDMHPSETFMGFRTE
jgi:hypothetical protein